MSKIVSAWPARMDVLQGLSGLLLVAFVWAHMFFESSILLGKDAMFRVTRMFEGEPLFGEPFPALVSAVGVLVFLLIALHAILALRKFPASYRQYRQFHHHRRALRHSDTTLWYVQVITGYSLFFLVSVHLYMVIAQPGNIGPYASSDRIWSGRFWVLYALLLVAVHVHAGIGVYRLVMKWRPPRGANARQQRERLKRALWFIVAFFLCLGSASLITYSVIGYQHRDHVGERYHPDSPVPHREGS